jgi:HAMP domain-containing protein
MKLPQSPEIHSHAAATSHYHVLYTLWYLHFVAVAERRARQRVTRRQRHLQKTRRELSVGPTAGEPPPKWLLRAAGVYPRSTPKWRYLNGHQLHHTVSDTDS